MEYATLHEMKNLHFQKNSSKNDAELLQMAADSVNLVRTYSLTKAKIGPPVPMERGIEGTNTSRPANEPHGMEWKHILSRSEREEFEALTDFAQGMIYTAVARDGKPPAQAGTTESQAPIK